ncbi:MAG: bacteriophage abortive infection AbiH family protein [Bacteroidetes bacterium]|nr:bacteriophage abortive infection AbiH family protein [Bacteroidota bacterium]
MGNGKLTLVIGNGFDLNLGLKTSYTDFLKSNFFTENIDKHVSDVYDSIFKYLFDFSVSKQMNWIDIENLFKSYYQQLYVKNHGKIENLYLEFNFFVQALRKYLIEQKIENISDSEIEDSFAYFVLQQAIGEDPNLTIINFNYTDSVEYILINKLGKNEDFIKNNVIHVHGTLKNNNIIVGVDESFETTVENNFIRKFSNVKYINTDVDEILENSNIIGFFGHSFGETDHSYFESFFLKYSDKKNFEYFNEKGIIIFYYGEIDWYYKDFQLMKLTNKRFKGLMDANKFQKIDVSKNDKSFSPFNIKFENYFQIR